MKRKLDFKNILAKRTHAESILNSLGDGVITTNRKGFIRSLNKVAEILTGWDEKNAKGLFIDKVLYIKNAESRKKENCQFDKIIKEGKTVGLTSQSLLVSKRGDEIPVYIKGIPVKNNIGRIQVAVFIFKDLSIHRKKQRISDTRLLLVEYSIDHSLIDVIKKAMNEICNITSSSFGFLHIVDANRKRTSIIGWSSSTDCYDNSGKEYIINQKDPRSQCFHRRIPFINNEPEKVAFKCPYYEIEQTTYRVLAVPVIKGNSVEAIIEIFDKASEFDNIDSECVLSIGNSLWEIMKRKKTKESYMEESLLLSSLISTLPDTVYFKDTECNFIKINHAQAKNLGLNNTEDAIGKSDADFFSEEHAGKTFRDEQKIIITGKPLIDVEEKEVLKDGTVHWVSSTKIPLKDSSGSIIGIMGLSRNITNRKKLEEDLILARKKAEESDKLKSAFLANMSHEIRTPLNGVLGFTNLLINNDNLSQEEKRNYTSIINNCSEGLLQVINDILEISKIESGTLKIVSSPFQLDNTLNDLLSIYEKKIGEFGKDISLTLLSDYTNIILNTDKNRLQQILINLLDNALKFTEKGRVQFGVESIKNNRIYFMVCDTGIGIPKEMKDIVFERFRQINSNRNQINSGNGLGLSIVQKLIDLMGGKVWIDSEYLEGSCFKFYLPYSSLDTEIEKHSSFKKNNSLDSLNILLVEDDEASRLVVSELLSNSCNNLFLAVNGASAYEISKTKNIDLILMDIGLPDINGLEVVKEIRKINNEVVIIAQTAFAMQSDRELALSAGCNDFLSKPITLDELVEKISRIGIQ